MTDKGSQDENTGAEALAMSSPPRAVDGPSTGAGIAAANPEPEPAAPGQESSVSEQARSEPEFDARVLDEPAIGPLEPASDGLDGAYAVQAFDGAAARDDDLDLTERRMYLPPVFERPFTLTPPPSLEDEVPPEPQVALAPEPAVSEPPSPAFTAAAYDLFHPRETHDPPTYQTRDHGSYAEPIVPARADAAPPVSGREPRTSDYTGLLWTIARYAGYFVLGYFALVLLLILAFRFVNPPASALMIWRWITGTSINHAWVPLERMSSNLVRAVIVAEDGRFCAHHGIDFEAMAQAIEEAADGTPRGASTISMQVTKNMFLWPAKNLIRKAIELPLTLVVEIVWPKARILEVYLNVAELGPGLFGAEAAARAHFRQPAARLSERQASLLAASLPNPMIRDAGDPGPRTSRKARVVQARMRAAGPAVAACVLGPNQGRPILKSGPTRASARPGL